MAIPKKQSNFMLVQNTYSISHSLEMVYSHSLITLIENIPKSIEFIRAVAQGDLGAFHTHQVWPDEDDTRQWIFSGLNRNWNIGKIVEHWDAMQQISKTSANGNTID